VVGKKKWQVARGRKESVEDGVWRGWKEFRVQSVEGRNRSVEDRVTGEQIRRAF